MKLGLGLGLIPSTARRRAWLPPSLPTASGVTIYDMWLPGVGTSSRLTNLYGGDPLTVTGSLGYGSNYYPSGRPALYFDGTSYLSAPNITSARNNVGLAIIWRSTYLADYTPAWGIGGNVYSSASGANSLVGDGSSNVGGTFCPCNQDAVIVCYRTPTLRLDYPWGLGGGAGVSDNSSTLTGLGIGARDASGGTGGNGLLGKGYFGGAFRFGGGSLGGITAFMQYFLNLVFMPKPSAAKVVVGSGDSIMSGVGLTYEQSLWGQIRTNLGSSWSGYSVAVPGKTVQNCIDNDAARVDAAYLAGRTATVAILGGEPSNTINGGASGATSVTQVESWAAARKSAGLKAIVNTCAARTDFDAGKETARTDYNSAMLAKYTVATANPYVWLSGTGSGDALVDIASITAGALQGDGVHPDATRAAAFAVAFAYAVQSVTP